MTKSDNEKDNVDWKDLRFLYFITNVHIHAYDGGGNLEAIKDADEVEILESLLVDPAPVNTAYGDLVLLSTCLQEQAQSPSSRPKTIVVSVVIAIYTRWMDPLKLCHFQFFEFTEIARQLESTGATLIFMATALHQKVIFWTPIKLGDVWALMTRYHRLHLFSGAVGRMVQCQSYKTYFGIGKLYNMVQGTCGQFIISIFSI